MKFSEFVLRSRKRVHDARDENGNVIVDATVDGIRWTSNNLVSAISEALMEFTRDILSLNFKSYFNSAYLYRFIVGSIATATGRFTQVGTDEINDIIRIETPNGAIRYSYVDPDMFFSDEYQNNALEEETYVFTQVIDSASIMTTYVLPIPAVATPVRIFCDINLEPLFVLANTNELPFHNIDDLMLDYVGRNCNLIEHDNVQYELYNKVIDKKLQIIKARDVKEMGT